LSPRKRDENGEKNKGRELLVDLKGGTELLIRGKFGQNHRRQV